MNLKLSIFLPTWGCCRCLFAGPQVHPTWSLLCHTDLSHTANQSHIQRAPYRAEHLTILAPHSEALFVGSITSQLACFHSKINCQTVCVSLKQAVYVFTAAVDVSTFSRTTSQYSRRTCCLAYHLHVTFP
jgi:hypothetical protein